MSRTAIGFGVVLSLFLAEATFASSICPAPNGGDSDGEGVSGTYLADTVVSGGVVQNDTGCNVLITFNANGSIVSTYPNAAPSYDSGGDDNLIGILNLTGAAISTITLTSMTDDIFAFDGDGICGASISGPTPGYTFVGGGNPCTNIIDTSYGTYGGPWVTYSNISSSYTSGNVNFANGGIAANGGTSFFSLEGPVDVNLMIGGSPEPATITLLGAGCLALAFFRRRLAR